MHLLAVYSFFVCAGGTSKPVAVPIGLHQPKIDVPGMVSSRDVYVFSADGVFGDFWVGSNVCHCAAVLLSALLSTLRACMDHLYVLTVFATGR